MNKITILASLQTFYASGHDLIDVFSRLFLRSIESQKNSSLANLQNTVLEKYKVNLPIDILQTIAKRLNKNKLIKYENLKNGFISLTEEGVNLQNKIEEDLKIKERENNALILSIKNFLREKTNNEYAESKIIEELNLFIEESAEEASFILSNGSSNGYRRGNGISKYFTDYFILTEKQDPTNYERLKSILFGEIIAKSVLENRTNIGAKFKNLNVYLDTNIVFSLMCFHEDEFNQPTKELIDIIKSLGINLKIFNFTKDEIIKTLRGYLDQESYYSKYIKVNSIYHILKRNGYSKTDLLSVIENIEEKISELGIGINYSYDIDSLLEKKGEQIEGLQREKPDKNIESIKHDIAAILAIRKLRKGGTSSLIEKSREIFLSADRKLSIFNNQEFSHGKNNTIPEVILRNQLTGILWLKKIRKHDDNIFVRNLLITQMNENRISSSLWDKFINELKKQKAKSNISDDDIDLIMSYEETGSILREKGEDGIQEIFNDERIGQKKVELQKMEIKQKENEDKIKKQEERLFNVAKNIEKDCKIKVSRVINFVIIISFIILVVLLVIFLYINLYLLSISLIVLIFISLELLFKKDFLPQNFSNWMPPRCKFSVLRINIENKIIQRCIIKNKKKLDIID